MFFYVSAEVLRHGKAIIFENNSHMVCICPFFVVPLQSLEDYALYTHNLRTIYAQFTHNTRTIHGQ